MSSKTTLYLLVVAVVMAAFAYFYENKQPGTRESNGDAKRLVAFDRDKSSGLAVTDHDLKIELQEENAGHWRRGDD